ncbi:MULTISPECIES: PepSY-associated TM helix domain-containing protein [Priestia]|uniref:Membrane protein, putative n=1 Tax=Priestia megaterium (strain ATCC 12872 / QMB1551) TaxID=545693 RepID=D5E4I4_PRIM1|nr:MULTISPECIES: PepSY domain-containing protein [Priestia]ADE72709.1 membrane protein, putative [Priestia megaterium QM B1551]MBG9930924.1 PepSY-associated TM helix domain-containing protein [Priestia aryabhattai]
MKNKNEENLVRYSEKSAKASTSNSFYRTVWRWHFYAGIIFAPFLIILAFTGSIYLFKPQIEQVLYKDYYNVNPQGYAMSASQQIEEVKKLYPQAEVTKYWPGDNATRSSEVSILSNGKSLTVFINPYTGKSLGELNDKDRIMDRIEEFHGELMAGKVGDRIVELAACWAIVLIISGIFLWFPRKKTSLSGVLFPRIHKGKKIFRRDLHVVPAFWITGGMLFLIMTGLPWSGFWGNNFQTLTTNSGVGYPPSIWIGSAPQSITKTKDIADVPWAAENLEVPVSKIQGLTPLSIDDVVHIANREKINSSYTVYIPQKKEGVYTLSAFPPRAQDEVTMHIDQYSGAVLADYRYDNYGLIGKIVALGITLHKGTQFGFINQLISLLICLGIIFVIGSGLYLWWKRKPKKELGAPKATSIKNIKSFLILLVGLGFLFPLVGLSLIIVCLVDLLIIQRLSVVKNFMNA